MNRFVGLILGFLCMAAAGPVAVAQQAARDPHIGYILPAGGQQGTKFTVTVGGQFLEGTSGLRITGSGISATVIDHFQPLPLGQVGRLRDKMQELQEKKRASQNTANATRPIWTTQDEQAIADIIKKLATVIRKPSSPAIVESVTLEVSIARDAEPGERELRLITPGRITNPLPFFVGTLPEISEKPSRLREEPTRSVLSDSYTTTIPIVVNGQIMPGGVDRYRFTARKGQDLVAIARARSLVPYISDAVPGWFQATLTLLDSKGRELAYDDDFYFNPDPALHVRIPENGEYTLEIKDAIYRGREDFVYRVEIGELPVVTSVFPIGMTVGSKAVLDLAGWNLRAQKLNVDAGKIETGVYPLTALAGFKTNSGSHPLALPWSIQSLSVDTVADVLEKEPNNTVNEAQRVVIPTIVNGRIATAGDCDLYRIEGRAGDRFVAEVRARRLGSPLDSFIEAIDSNGKPLVSNDDYDDKTVGLITHQADSRMMVTLPSDGVCYVRLRDTQGKFGAASIYRLYLFHPRPDFALIVTPSSVTLRNRPGSPLTVHALRYDGFAGDITLAIDGSPSAIKLSETRIPAGKDQITLTMSAEGLPAGSVFSLHLHASAMIDGKQVVHDAIAAEDMMQAFLYRHYVSAKEFVGYSGGSSPSATQPMAGGKKVK